MTFERTGGRAEDRTAALILNLIKRLNNIRIEQLLSDEIALSLLLQTLKRENPELETLTEKKLTEILRANVQSKE